MYEYLSNRCQNALLEKQNELLERQNQLLEERSE